MVFRIGSSGMLSRVALLRTDVSEELSAPFIRVTIIGETETTLVVTSNRSSLRRNSVVPSSPILVTLMKGGAKFLRKVGSYKRHTA
jgi:hypothetical protein